MIMRWKVRLKFRILRPIGVPQRKMVVGEELIPSLTTSLRPVTLLFPMLGPSHDTEALWTPRPHVQALSPCKQLTLATLSPWEYELCKEPAQTLEMGSGLFAQGNLESWIARA